MDGEKATQMSILNVCFKGTFLSESSLLIRAKETHFWLDHKKERNSESAVVDQQNVDNFSSVPQLQLQTFVQAVNNELDVKLPGQAMLRRGV